MNESRTWKEDRTAGVRLGSLLVDAVQHRDHDPAAEADREYHARLFVESMERPTGSRRRPGARPRYAAVAVAAVSCIVVAFGHAVWAPLSAQVRAAQAHAAQAHAAQPHAAQPIQTRR